MTARFWTVLMGAAAVMLSSCGIYSPYGAQTTGASTFSVEDFEPSHPLVSTTAAQFLAEALRDRIQRQSTLRLAEDGELEFRARVVNWEVRPVNVQGNETAGANRITVAIVVTYINERDPSLNLDRTFSRYVDLPSNEDVFSQEEVIVEELGDLLSQDVFNATLGNW